VSAFTGELACLRCGSRTVARASATPCERCAGEGIAVSCLPAYDLTGLSSLAPDERQPGLFRHRQLLPLAVATPAVSLHEGRTPMLRCGRLGDRLGVGELWIKDETRNPTWSYKDRLAAVAVTQAVEAGADTVVVSSTGNHGAAVAAYAAAAGLRCVVLTIATVPAEMKILMQSFGAAVLQLRTGPERWVLMAQVVRDRGWTPMSGYVHPPLGSNPFGVEGYKSIAYEIVEHLGSAPDAVVVPTAYGDGIAGIARGFFELQALGEIDAIPRLIAADPLGAYAAARRDGPGTMVPGRPTVAFSTGTPIATYQGVWATTATGGTAVGAIADSEILGAQRSTARLTGLYLENSSAAAVVVVRRLVDAGVLGDADRVVVVGTSTGLKDTAATAAVLEPTPTIDPTLDSLDTALDAIATGRSAGSP